jgi:membrane associated rhomboid family serine protease
MIPYRDTIPTRYTPWMTWAIIALNLAAFAYTQWLSDQDLYYFLNFHGLVPARYTNPDWAVRVGFPPGDYTPFVSSMFIHGGALHLVLNLWLLWIFGDNVEDRMGSVRFLAFYLICGLIAGIVHIYTNSRSNIPTIGASGAIAGVMGAYYFLFPYARVVIWMFFLPWFVEVPAIAFLGIWVIIQLYKVTVGTPSDEPFADVAWFGHLGGFIAGMLLYRFFLLEGRKDDSYFGRHSV